MTDVEVESGLTEDYELRNYSGLETHVIREDPAMRGLARTLARWSTDLRGTNNNRGNMFDRSTFTPPDNPYDEMRTAKTAVELDDVVSGVADITEAFAFQGMKWESMNADEADVFNQWSAEVDFDSVLRRFWREEFTYSQVVVAMQWDWREYKVRGRITPDQTEQETIDALDPSAPQPQVDTVTGQPTIPKKPKGRKRRKTYRLYVPVSITTLDPTKIVPVGHSPIGPEKLAWCASEAEMGYWKQVQDGRIIDIEMDKFYLGRYIPPEPEERRLARMGVPTDRLLLLNPELVFRHTQTKADYEAYPTLRMKSIFGILDLKRQLVNADRASLIGAANYILLVKKGSDDRPGTPEEVNNLKENYNFIAKMPVIISDHRLNIEIIAPKVDLVLQGEKYDTLDSRLLQRLLGTLSIGGKGQRNETNVTLSYAVAKMMENRRHMMKRTIEARIGRAIAEHVNNKKTLDTQVIEESPSLVFMPRSVQLGFDQALLQAMLSLRTQREISRETILEQFGLDEATEAMRLEYEADVYDDIFKTQIPFAAPGAGGAPAGANTGDPVANGRQGGRPSGGGAPTKDATKVGKTGSDTGNTKRSAS